MDSKSLREVWGIIDNKLQEKKEPYKDINSKCWISLKLYTN